MSMTSGALFFFAVSAFLFWLGFSKSAPEMKQWRRIFNRVMGVVSLMMGALAAFIAIHPSKTDGAYVPHTYSDLLPPSPAADWKRYEYKDGGYSANFQAVPEMKVESPSKDAPPNTPPSYVMHVSLGGTDYRISATAIPDTVTPPPVDTILDRAKAYGQQRQMELLSGQRVPVGGTEGAELLYKTKEGWLLKTRIFVANKKYFQIITVGSVDDIQKPDIENFMGSVQQP